MSAIEQESRDHFVPGAGVWGIPDHVRVLAAVWASDHTPPGRWVQAMTDSPVWVAALGTDEPSGTYADYLGEMTLGQARSMAQTFVELDTPSELKPVTEAERLGATVNADLVRRTVLQAVSTDGRPDVIMPTIGQGLRAVAQLVRSLHGATMPQFHLEMGVKAEHCPVCLAEDDQRRRDRLYPGRLNQVEAEISTDLGRDIERLDLLGILVEVDRAEDWLAEHGRPDDPYAVAVNAAERMGNQRLGGPSLMDVARVVRALRRIREMERA